MTVSTPCRGIIRAELDGFILLLWGNGFLPPVGESSVLSIYWRNDLSIRRFLPPVGESSVLSISLADTEDNTVSSTIYSTLRCSASHGVKRNLKNSQNHP